MRSLLPALYWLAVLTTACGHGEDSLPPSGASGSGGSGAPGQGGGGAGGSGAASQAGQGGTPENPALGAYPTEPSPVTRGGTITFTNVGSPGWWPRRLDREPGDPGCDYKDGTDTWGGHCCMTEHATASTRLAPFDEEMALILKAVNVRQLAVYQPRADGPAQDWSLVSSWDARDHVARNLWFTQNGEGSATFPGDLTHDDCNWYVMQEPMFDCGNGHDYYCPDDPGIKHLGWSGSKMIVFLGSMTFPDSGVSACGGTEAGHPGPWVAFDAAELFRDGARKWDGQCNCYSKTGTVGDGCGEINVFEVVMDGNDYSNREFMSTGVRSYQAGHVGGSVCGADCTPNDFAADSDVVDACAHQAYATGPVVDVGGAADGCPVWRRPVGDRYFMILLDEQARTIQVAVVHPDQIPPDAATLLPELPHSLPRSTLDALLSMRLPNE